MPEQSHPPYAIGATTIPRQLQRWLDINPQNGPLNRTSTYIQLPVFNVANSWNGYSDIVLAFNCEGGNSFSLKSFVLPTSPNFVLTIAYRVGNVVTRYLLWDAAGSKLDMVVPAYTGQVIKPNFRFEVWNTSQGAVSNTAIDTFYTSVSGQVDYRFGKDLALLMPDASTNTFQNINIPIVPNLASIQYRLKSNSSLHATGSVFNSWTDSISGVVFTATAASAVLQVLPVTQLAAIPSVGALLNGTGVGANPGSVAIVFNLITLPIIDTNIFDNGGGVVFGIKGTTHKLTSYSGGNGNKALTANTWYIVLLTPSSGQVTLYDLVTGTQLDNFYSGSSTGPDGTILLGCPSCAIVEVLIYNQDNFYFNPPFYNNIVGYLVQTYSVAMSLPLTFPTNSVAVTN